MLQKKLIQIYNNKILIFFLALLAFFINYYYGFIGMMPMDNTVLFNGGFRVLKGYIPFTDYWLVTGPLLDYLNAFFFKILGISWSTFIFHSSLVNSILAISSFYFFRKINLSSEFAFFYSLLISILFYPVVGTPFVDHHSTFFMILSFYGLIIAVKTDETNFFLLIPTLLSLSFLSKQTPAAYGIISVCFFVIAIIIFNKKLRLQIFKKSLIGFLIAILFLLAFFLFTRINFIDFFQQYINFGSSIGKERLSNYNFNLFNEIYKYKFISLFLIFLFVTLIKLKIKKVLTTKDFFIIVISIILSINLVFHQLISLNQNFIFFLIPFLCGIFHSYYKKAFEFRYLLILLIAICLFTVGKYHIRFNEERKFNELEKVDISKSIDAEIIDEKLKGLKWITYLYPNDPKQEITSIIEAINFFKNGPINKMLITEYQIISPILNIYDNSPNQWHHPSVSFPLKGNEYFNFYKDYFVSKIKKNKIEFIYETKEDDKTITELVLNKDCFEKERLSKMLIKLKLNKDCEDFK